MAFLPSVSNNHVFVHSNRSYRSTVYHTLQKGSTFPTLLNPRKQKKLRTLGREPSICVFEERRLSCTHDSKMKGNDSKLALVTVGTTKFDALIQCAIDTFECERYRVGDANVPTDAVFWLALRHPSTFEIRRKNIWSCARLCSSFLVKTLARQVCG